MADIGAELITYLKSQSGITSVVGSGSSARILQQASMKESSTRPALCVTITNDEQIDHMGGYSALARADVSIEANSDSIADRNTLAAAVRAAMVQHPSGDAMGSTPVAEVCLTQGRNDFEILAQDNSDLRIYASIWLYRIWYYTS